MLPRVIFDKKVPYFPKKVSFKAFLGNTLQKVSFFEDWGCCPKIIDYTLLSVPTLDILEIKHFEINILIMLVTKYGKLNLRHFAK